MKKYLPFQFDHGSADSSTWHLPDGAIARFGKGNIVTMALSPDGTLLAIGSYLGLWLYDVTKSTPLALWEVETQVSAVAFSACGEWVATSSWGGPIKIWDVKSENCLVELARHESGGNSKLAFSPNCEWFVVGGATRHYNREEKLCCSVEVWHIPRSLDQNSGNVNPEREAIYVGTNPLAFSPDGRLLAFASPDGAPEPFNTNGYPVIDGRWLLDSSRVVVYEIATGENLITLDGGKDVSSISFSPCGKFLAVCDRTGITKIWKVPVQLSTEVQPWTLHKVYQEVDDNASQNISYAPENRLLATVYAYKDDTFSVHDLENSEILYQHPKETGPYNPDYSNGTRLAFESENDVHIWIEGENQLISLRHTAGVFPGSLQFSLDGKTL